MVIQYLAGVLKKNGTSLLQFCCFVHLFNSHVLEVSQCTGPSMLPTLNVYGDTLILDKIAPRLGRLGIGDLVVFSSPRNPSSTNCKRIIGMEGDTICRNPDASPENRHYLKVPPGRIWVQGDNNSNSTDSRIHGPLPLGLVKARVLFRLYPFTDFRNNLNTLFGSNPFSRKANSLTEVDLEYLTGKST